MTDHTVSFPFLPGDLVMAKYDTFPYWPAVVIANCHTSERNIEDLKHQKKRGKKYAYVLFMGERNFGMCESDRLTQLTKEKAEKLSISKTEKPKKKAAYKDAASYTDYWSLLIEANLVNPNEEKYELKSIYDLPPGGKRKIPADSQISNDEDVGELDEDEEDEEEEEEEEKKIEKRTPKGTARSRNKSTPSTKVPAAKKRRVTAPKVKEEEEEDNSRVIKTEEEPDTPEALEKKAYGFRVHLQKGLVQKNRMPTVEEMDEANKYFEELEKFSPKVTKELLKKYKLHKVLKVIGRTDQLEEKAPEYKFRERSQRLVLEWDSMLSELANEKARDTPNATIDAMTSVIKSDTAEILNEEKNGTSIKAEKKPENESETTMKVDTPVKSKEDEGENKEEKTETTNGDSAKKETLSVLEKEGDVSMTDATPPAATAILEKVATP